jgi:hypothetical protein
VDNSFSWAPRPQLVGLAWLAAAGAAVWAVLTDDPPGRVLVGVAAIVLALAGLFGTLARPRLAVDTGGVTVRGMLGRRHWSWAEVNVRLVRTRRLGRDMSAVELDAEHAEQPALMVLGWLDLGADPEDVVDAIRGLRT